MIFRPIGEVGNLEILSVNSKTIQSSLNTLGCLAVCFKSPSNKGGIYKSYMRKKLNEITKEEDKTLYPYE